jgi:hypothetical protein
MRFGLLGLAALALSGCAAQLTGNESGGVVMHGGRNPPDALTKAEEHCRAYGKSAKLTSIVFKDYSGDPVLFECVAP